MMLYGITLSLMLIGSCSIFGADRDHSVCTLVVSPTKKYYVSKHSFDASRKLCTLNEEKIEYGNVLCAEHHSEFNHYVIKEVWYRINEKGSEDEIPIKVVSEQPFHDHIANESSFNTKQNALEYIKCRQPYGLSGSKECDFKGQYGCFVAPQNAVLLCLLQGDKIAFNYMLEPLIIENEMSIFCVSEDNDNYMISHLYFEKGDLKLGDQHYTFHMCALSRSIGIPEELQWYKGKKFKNEGEALKALEKHIETTYFSVK